MKDLNSLNKFRKIEKEIFIAGCKLGNELSKGNGIFEVRVGGKWFRCHASDGGGWEHVSVVPLSGNNVPTWKEMCVIKDMFFEEDEAVMQLHPKKSDYVNIHPNCLHLWKPTGVELPLPPKEYV